MASPPNTREKLVDWCMRKLGWPVLEINIDDDQIDDRVTEALQFFQDFHSDGVERTYVKYALTDTDITNQYIPIDESIISVSRIFPFDSNLNTGNIFDYQYQWRLNDFSTYTPSTFTNYVLTRQYIQLFDNLFVGEAPIRFNRHLARLYIDWKWSDARAGTWIVYEGYVIIDPNTYTSIYNDRMLKEYLTALLKLQWGVNLKKYAGIQLVGNVTLDGNKIYEEAQAEVKEIEEKIQSTYQEPPMFIMG